MRLLKPRHKLFFKRILVITMLILFVVPNLLTNAISPFAEEVLAKDEKKDDKDKEGQSSAVSGGGNVYNQANTGEDIAFKAGIQEATKYDKNLHYLMTYSYLSQNIGMSPTKSNYNKIYRGGKIEGAGKVGNDIETTNGEKIIADIKGINVHEGGSGLKNPDEIEDVKKALVDGITNDITPTLIDWLSYDVGKADFKFNVNGLNMEGEKLASQKNNKYVNDAFTRASISSERTGSSRAKITKKTNPSRYKEIEKVVKKEVYNHINASLDITAKERKAIEKLEGKHKEVYLKQFIRNKLSFRVKNTNATDGKLSYQEITENFQKTKRSYFGDKSYKLSPDDIDFFNKNVDYTSIQTKKHKNRTDVFTIPKHNMSELDKGTKFFGKMGKKDTVYDLEPTNNFKEYISFMYKYQLQRNLTGTTKGYQRLGDKIDKYLNTEKGTKQSLKYLTTLKTKEAIEKEVKDNVKGSILSYQILTPSFKIDELKEASEKSRKNFKKTFEAVEGITNEGSYFRDKDGNKRALNMQDLYYHEENSTPMLTLFSDDLQNKYAQYYFGRSSTKSDGKSIGRYAGIYNKNKNWFSKLIDNVKEATVGGEYPPSAFKKLDGAFDEEKVYPNYNLRMSRAIASDIGKTSAEVSKDSKSTVGIDNYGNIINTDNGMILIPYWQNETVKSLGIYGKNKDKWVSHQMLLKQKNVDILKEKKVYNNTLAKEADISYDDIKKVYKNADVDKKDVENVREKFSKASNEQDIYDIFIKDGKIDKKVVKIVSFMIATGTHEGVKKFNKEHAEAGKQGKELFIQLGEGDYSGGDDSKDKSEEFTNADLRERIRLILDYGFFEVLRLTLASMVVSIYNSAFFHYSMSFVFHTNTIADSEIWSDLVRAFGLFIIGGMSLYLIFMAFKVFRSTMKMSEVVKQFILVTLVILVPTVIYAPLINTLINKPTDYVLGKQLQQMAVIDTYMDFENESKENSALYKNMFATKSVKGEKFSDYLIDIYTTQHKSGYDITEPKKIDDIGFRDQIRSSRAIRTGQWNKNDVVKVSVSVFDLFEWARIMVDGIDKDGKKVEKVEQQSFFDWIADNEEKAKEYKGIYDFTTGGKYDEFGYDTTLLAKQIGKKKEDAKAERIKATDLFKDMYEASSPYHNGGKKKTKGNGDPDLSVALMDRIYSMKEIHKLVKGMGYEHSELQMEDVNTLIDDLSLTGETRGSVFGYKMSEDNPNNLMIPNISEKSRLTLEEHSLYEDFGLPTQDFLSIETFIDRVLPVADPTGTTKQKHIYNINQKVLKDYITTQAVAGSHLEGSKSSMNNAEFMMITLNEFFTFNEELNVPLFPTTIKPETLSLDTFVRMLYIPYHEYFVEDNPKGIDNVAEYLSLRDNPILLLITFIPMLVLLALWGLVYALVLSVLMMVVSTISFIWHYVIKGNSENKSWLGSIIIILLFAFAKLGLELVWSGASYIMNYTYDKMGGTTYAYSFIHSLIMLGYMAFCFKFIFIRVLKALKDDMTNLGANEFIEQGKNMVAKLKGKMNGVDTKAERGLGRGNRSSVRRRRRMEGARGKLNPTEVGTALRNVTNKIKRKGSNPDDISQLNSVASGTGNKLTQRYPELTKGVSGRARKRMLSDYDKIAPSSETGISPQVMNALEQGNQVGRMISTSADGSQIATIMTGNAEQGQLLADHLNEQGLPAKVNKDGNVVFNTKGRDLSNASVRKGIYGSLVDNLYNEIEEESKLVSNVEDNATNYHTTQDGKISVEVGDKGLSTKSLDTLIQSRAFKDNFVIEDKPVKDTNGNYIAGAMEIRARENVDETTAMAKLFSEDTANRKVSGEQDRGKTYNNQSIEYEGLSQDGRIYDILEDGMYVQGDKIMYSTKNRKHVKAIEGIQKEFNKEVSKRESEKIDMLTRLSSQTAYGENYGYKTDYVNTAQDKDVEMSARSVGLTDDKVESVFYAGKDTENVTKRLDSIQKLSKLQSKELGEYNTARDNLYREGERMLFRGNSEKHIEEGFWKMAEISSREGASTDLIEKYKQKQTELRDLRNNGDMLSKEYKKEVKGLYGEMKKDLQSEGIYTKAISSEIYDSKSAPKDAKKAMNKFANVKKGIKNKGISPDELDKFNGDEYKELQATIEDIESVQDNGDGTVKIRSNERLNEGDIARLINGLK